MHRQQVARMGLRLEIGREGSSGADLVQQDCVLPLDKALGQDIAAGLHGVDEGAGALDGRAFGEGALHAVWVRRA